MRILVFLLFILPQASAQPEQMPIWPAQFEVTASSLKLRESPNQESKALATLPQGAILENLSNIWSRDLVWAEIDGKSAYWIKVRFNGKTGYVFGAYVVPSFHLFYEDISIEYFPYHKNWYGVYSSPKGDELRKIDVYTSLDSNEMSEGLDLTLRSRDPAKSKFIIGTNQELKTGILGNFFNRFGEDAINLSGAIELKAGTNCSLNSLYMTEAAYDIMCTGSFELGTDWLVQKDFKIWITKRPNGGSDISVKQDLLPYTNPPQQTHTIKWFGDLDGDGKPDLIMGLCNREGGCFDILFLSTKAQKGELIGAATHFMWGFGC